MTMRIYDDEVKPATRERCLKAEPLSRATVRSFLTLLCCMLLLLLPESQATAEASRSLSVASDGPGALSYFDLARKDCIGTARNTTSKVWFTLADGVLSDVYFPTVDNTNVKTLQYIVTDGRTFTDLQTRDTTYSVQLLDGAALDCRVIATARSGRYRIVTDYVTDPARNSVVMHLRFTPLAGSLSDYHLYLYFDPTVNGNGGGGAGNGGADSALTDTSTGQPLPIAFDTNTRSNAANRSYAVPVYTALAASRPFLQVSNGFLGAASDGLVQLEQAHALTQLYAEADNGNVVQTAELDLSHGPELTVALGFGTTRTAALQAARGSLNLPFARIRADYAAGWQRYDAMLRPAPRLPGVDGKQWQALQREYYLSANVIKASEDKTFPGAIVASLASPWGQAVSAGDPNNLFFGSYREVFARDLYEAWTGLLLDGDLQTARDAVTFLFYRQQRPDGSMPRNSLLNGQLAPDSFGTQLDETSYPILMAYQLHMSDADLYQHHIKPAAYFVMSHGPAYGVERWEEQSGYSPSTIAAEIAGLVAAAQIARANGDEANARLWLGVADDWQRSLERWTVTTTGPLATHPYYIRLSKAGDPNAAISYNLGNGGPTLDQRSVIDAGFLELVRLGLKPASDPVIAESLPVVDATIKSQTSSGPGWHRYNGDGYGDGASDGHPWAPSGVGTGHVWPVLGEERGEYALANGDLATAVELLTTMQRFASGVGLIPEQDWELPDLAPSPYGTDPTVASIGFQNGHPAGSASPLTWAEGAFVRLFLDLGARSLLERPTATYARYVLQRPGQTPLSIATPADLTAVDGSPVTVRGSSAPGNTIYVAGTNTDSDGQTTLVSAVAAADGSFSVQLPISSGTTVITVVAFSPGGATAHATRTIVWDYTPGTVLLDVNDPAGDDNGPGNYAYPTAGDFHAGAFDILEFRVIDSGDSIVFKLKVRDLTPTFGSPLGAQLIDVYVHDPNAAPADTSTAASFPQRNYTIAAAAAWSRLIEVQGFGQRYIDAHGTSLGSVSISANSISRFITFSVPKASLGQPGPGWGFTVTLTGQDGFQPDQARAFTSTPGPYTFGVCSTVSSDPHCTADPGTVPKVIDTLTPPGVQQADELDYTRHQPVVLQDIVIP
uniref:Glucan 1,4-alpha-glucosidase n=1 Tax=Thermogemmatispora argillosa TaxID=2045280 RepID=A0A455SZZ4_9CHLR|nr:glucan 1,4-alpha-glucosidase [Thermogemmatispora argillosa]